MCGQIIPEGRMVCPLCEADVLAGEKSNEGSIRHDKRRTPRIPLADAKCR